MQGLSGCSDHWLQDPIENLGFPYDIATNHVITPSLLESRDNEDLTSCPKSPSDAFTFDSSSVDRQLKRGRSTQSLPQPKRSRFPRSSVRILEQWLLDHRESPYATQQDQDILKSETGLKRSQIISWIANARKRGKARSAPSHAKREKDSDDCFSLSDIAHLHPFERWLYSSPDSEAASHTAILEALKGVEIIRDGKLPHRPSTTVFPPHGANWHYFHQSCSSATSMEIRSYAANAKSVTSDQWKHPYGSPTTSTRPDRRHRRQAPRSKPVDSENLDAHLKKFQCTFCSVCFKKKHDWQRHEKSQHLPLESWICCSQGGLSVDSSTNEVSCVFCGELDPSPTHFVSHGYPQCVARPSSERTFFRKDHLRQHLRLAHGGCATTPSMEVWRKTVTAMRSRCGFCDLVLDSWSRRAEHLSGHFREGALMENWKGDWGFEPHILAILERATLPEKRQSLSALMSLEANDQGSNGDDLCADISGQYDQSTQALSCGNISELVDQPLGSHSSPQFWNGSEWLTVPQQSFSIGYEPLLDSVAGTCPSEVVAANSYDQAVDLESPGWLSYPDMVHDYASMDSENTRPWGSISPSGTVVPVEGAVDSACQRPFSEGTTKVIENELGSFDWNLALGDGYNMYEAVPGYGAENDLGLYG